VERRTNVGFTLLELVTVLVIIGLLVAMIFPAVQSMQQRMEKAKCIANLRGLSLGVNSYVQLEGHWPQIDPKLIKSDYPQYAREWIEALKPHGVSESVWICPTIQKMLGAPDLKKRENTRADYIGMPFDDHPFTPYKWPKQPWFVERGAVHGNGSLIIFTNGTVREVNDMVSP